MRLLAVLALASVAFAVPPMLGGRPMGGFTSYLHQNVDTSVLVNDVNHGTKTLTQKQDHFDASNKKTWQQQYFYNTAHASDDSAVNMLYINGENVAMLSSITDESYSYVVYAKMLNATIYGLEHRYYGGSHPTEDLSTANLKFLSSRQAVEDIAEFIRQRNAEKGGEQKWIVVGGSYAGSLAAWSRLLHPELISGALSSSAPILAQMDFYGYLQHVEEAFKKVGGLCYKQLGDGIEEARKLFQSEEGRQQLTLLFGMRPPLSSFDEITEYDIDTFFKYLISPFVSTAQGSILNTPQTLCQTFTIKGENDDPLKALARINTYTGDMNINFTASVMDLSGEAYEGDTSARLWQYQTCAEFGYFKSTNRGKNVFGQIQSSNTLIEYCVQLFGIDADQIQKNVDATNGYYGGRDYYAGTNVVFSHGTQDPWSFLTKKSDPKHWSVVIVEVEGGTHVQDIGYSCTIIDDYCTKNMQQIQDLTLQKMQQWIDPIFSVPDRVEITDNVGQRPQLFDPNVRSSVPVNVNSYAPPTRAKRSAEVAQSSYESGVKRSSRWIGRGHQDPLIEFNAEQLDESELIGESWFEQTFDHFNVNEDRTFMQKWFYNYKFGTQEGPNFLLVGGEGVFQTDVWVKTESAPWLTYAKEVGANAFLLQHRYYGDSILGTNDLQYLTSAQMLYDIATFIKTQQVKNNRTGPWITFGGSYPGGLAIWARQWFPDLILGAVGSSVPVVAKNDNYEYLEVVDDVIHRQSKKCADGVADSFNSFRNLAQTPEGRATIQEKFNLEPAWTSDPNDTIAALDMSNVYYHLYAPFQDVVQYNDVASQRVASVCAFFESDAFEDSLDALSLLTYHINGNDSISSSYEADVQIMIDMIPFVDGHDLDTYSTDDLVGVLWTWQTCNEFGYYQTTDYADGIFGAHLPLNFFIGVCERMFGIGMDEITDRVARTNYQYGGRDRLSATNLMLTNNDGDPWHLLGVLEQGDLDKSVVPFVIRGTSHVADMLPATPADPPTLTQARQITLDNIKKWLAPQPTSTQAPVVTTTSGVTHPQATTKTSEETTTQTTTTTTTLSPTTTSVAMCASPVAAMIVLMCFNMLF